jgi:tape measure domain-containing protein
MALNIGDVVANIKADMSNFQKGMSDAKQSTNDFGDNVKKVAAIVGTALAAIGIAKFAKDSLTMAGNFEQSQVAFTTMLGSAEKANTLLQEITTFAAKTPFELPGLIDASKKMLAFGFAQEDIIPTMTKLGDIAAGLGVPVGQLVNVYGQVSLAGKLTGQDLMQFTNAGVPLIKELAKNFGKTEAEIKDMVSAGKIGFKDVKAAMESMTGEGSTFGGMMEKQSQTFLGAVSNIKDGLGQFMTQVGTALLPVAKEFAAWLNTSIVPGLTAMVPAIQNGITAIVEIAKGFAFFLQEGDAANDFLTQGLQMFGIDLPTSVYVAMESVRTFILDIVGLGQKVFEFIEATKPIWEQYFQVLFTLIAQAVAQIWDKLVAAFNQIVTAIQPIMPTIELLAGVLMTVLGATILALVPIIGNLLTGAISVGTGIITAFSGLIEFVQGMFQMISGLISGLITGDFSAMQAGAQSVVDGVVRIFGGLGAIIGGLLEGAFGWAVDLFNGFKDSGIQAVADLVNGINDWVGGIRSSIEGAVDGLADIITRPFNDAKNAIGSIGNGVGDFFNNFSIPGFASGVHNFTGGLAMVGESGPELVRLPRGSDVFSNRDTGKMLNGAGGGGVTQQIGINIGSVNSDLDIASIGREFGFRVGLLPGLVKGN